MRPFERRVICAIRSGEDGADTAYFNIARIGSREKAGLANGLVMDHSIECPQHSGCFNYRDGETIRAPACGHLKSWPTKVEGGSAFVLL